MTVTIILDEAAGGPISDGDIPATIARDTEVTAAVAAHVAAGDPHAGYATGAELTAAVDAAVAALLGGAPPAALDTLDELAAALNDDANAVSALVTAIANEIARATAAEALKVNTADLAAAIAAQVTTALGLHSPFGWGMAFTAPPLQASSNVAISVIGGYGHAYRIMDIGPGAITKVGFSLGVATAGTFMSIAHCRGPAGRFAPNQRIVTTGAFAMPAVGYNEVNLVTTLVRGDWLAVSCDSSSPTIMCSGTASSNANAIGTGVSYIQAAHHPIPATPSFAGARVQPTPILVGIP